MAAIHVDPSLPVHPLTVDDVLAMAEVGLFAERPRVELIDGVLVEMNPMGGPHSYAVRRLLRLAFEATAATDLEVSPQCSLDVLSRVSLPEPDVAIIPLTPSDRLPGQAVLVVEVSVNSLRLDLGRKAALYAEGQIPEYWVLDVRRRELVVHRDPVDGIYREITRHGDDSSVTATGLPLTVEVAALL